MSSLRTPSKELSKVIGSEKRKIKKLFNDMVAYINKNKLGFIIHGNFFIEADQYLKPLFKKKEIHQNQLMDIIERNSFVDD